MRLCVPTAHVLDSTQTAHEGLDEEQGHDRRAKIAMSAAMPEEAMTHGYQFQAMAKLVTKRQIGNSNIRLVPEASGGQLDPAAALIDGQLANSHI